MVAIDFNVERHEYRLAATGERIRSVTDALSVVTNFDKVPPEILERARIFGHHVHKTIHYFCIGDLNEALLTPDVRARLFSFKRFLHETHFEVSHSEEVVVDRSNRYCGTLDLRGRHLRRGRRRRALIDLKSGAVPKTVGPQTAGYQYACEDPPELRFALQLAENSYRLIPLTAAEDYSFFISCLNVFKFSLKENPYAEETHR